MRKPYPVELENTERPNPIMTMRLESMNTHELRLNPNDAPCMKPSIPQPRNLSASQPHNPQPAQVSLVDVRLKPIDALDNKPSPRNALILTEAAMYSTRINL